MKTLPFNDYGNVELIHLVTRVVLGFAVIKTVYEVEELGDKQATQFIKERVVSKVMQVDDTVNEL